MEKRALLAFVLSLIVLFGYSYIIDKKGKNVAETPVPVVSHEEKPVSDPKEASTDDALNRGLSRIDSGLGDGTQVAEEFVQVETEVAKYRVSTLNGTIKEVSLKNYKNDLGEEIQLVDSRMNSFPLQIFSDDEKLNLGFTPSAADIRITEEMEKATLVLSFSNASGAMIEKSFTFHAKSYAVDVDIRQNLWNEYQIVSGGSFLESGEKSNNRYDHVGPVVDHEGDIRRIKLKEIENRLEFSGMIPWIAFEEKYFMTALIPEDSNTVVTARRISEDRGSCIVLGIGGKKESQSYVFYAGPKDYEILVSLGSGLEKVVNFGVFWFVAKPMFYVLKVTYKFVGNYGVAIILLTTFIKFIFMPLTYKQQKSMKDMQKVQPEMNVIREKYKGDQQRMSREMMELYKKHKINPAAGCLPLVIQIPVFFALYNVLLRAIELRGAPFLYIRDLSAADTLFGHVAGFAVGPLPLLMGVSMYVQQKMMPSAMDPKQAKIFQWLPVIFTFMFLNFPSGLVLYWLVNNLLTIFQQLYMDRKKKTVSA